MDEHSGGKKRVRRRMYVYVYVYVCDWNGAVKRWQKTNSLNI